MGTLLYCDSNQENLRRNVLSQNYAITCVNNALELERHYCSEAFPILIILSQPPKRLLEDLMSLKWSSILSFIGVRIEINSELNIVYFEDDIDFGDLYKACLKTQKNRFESHYIEQLGPLNDEDCAYIQALSDKTAVPINKFRSIKNFFKIKKPVDLPNLGLVTVMGNPEIAFHLAKCYARHSKEGVLIIDGNLLNPSMESYFELSNTSTKIKSHLSGLDNSGINIALDTVSKGFNLEDYIHNVTHYGGKNLRVLLGNYNFYNYEHYDIKQVKVLMTKLLRMYSTIILAVSENPYDSLTMLGLHMSRFNIITCRNHYPDVRYKYNLINVLKSKQGLSQSKNNIVSYSTRSKLPETSNAVSKELFRSNYLGHFNHNNFFNMALLKKIGERSMIWE